MLLKIFIVALYFFQASSQYFSEELVAKKYVNCEGDVFFCDDDHKECIPKDKLCNGVNECSTGKDESVEQCGCLKDIEFQCNASVCIDMVRRCDTKRDCEDGKDEEDCEVYECPPTHGKCANHFCVPRDVECNFKNDCGDWSDEKNCELEECYYTQYTCNNSRCIPFASVCNGNADCEDGDDEENCDSHFRCNDGTYQDMQTVCDGWEDCSDASDETNCGPCRADHHRCNNGRCIRKSNVCDGNCDCMHSCDDENECEYHSCSGRGVYQCIYKGSTFRCIGEEYVCDGINDCWNNNAGSDEELCLQLNETCDVMFSRNADKYFHCPEGRCIPASGPKNATCNHIAECLNGEDERECMFPQCQEGEYRCNNHQCIPMSNHCDGNFDCFDRTDETDCDDVQCDNGDVKCKSGQCIPNDWWCDYFRDCPDGSDETQCGNRRTCDANEFTCKNGQCIARDHVCYKDPDSRYGCSDESHLLNCSFWECQPGQFKCNHSFCIDGEKHCDGKPDCGKSYADEINCPYTCPYHIDICICQEDVMNCTNQRLKHLPSNLDLERTLTRFLLAGNNLGETLNSDTFVDLARLFYLDLSSNHITSLPDGVFRNLLRLVALNLQNNNIKTLKNGSFSGLTNLRAIYLSGNGIQEIYPSAFIGLSHLLTLDLSHHRILRLSSGSFLGLRSVNSLDLSHNKLEVIEDGAFNGLLKLLTLDLSDNEITMIESNTFHGLPRLRTLHTDEFPFCCMVKHVKDCYPKPNEFSSCEDLMSNFVLRISIWILGSLACFGNLLVIGWRIRDFQNGKVHSFLIANLAIGDFFMGIYLMIIAVVDTYYRGKYFRYDRYWRESAMCKFAGFMSTFSSELSVFTLTVITIDRLVCIIFPLKVKRLGMREALVVMPSLWILVLFLSACPLLGIEYFRNFYGRSGVCLALHITPDHVGGWEYSVFVFLVLNFISFLLIFISYLWMFFVAKKTTTAVRKSKAISDTSMAKKMTLIVMTDFMCWIPIILLGFASLFGARVPQQVYAWIAVFVLPLNSAINPVLYTISTATFLGNVRKRACRFRKSFTGSYRSTDTKHSIVDDRYVWQRNSGYRQLELTRLRGLNKAYSLGIHNNHSSISRM